MSSDRSKGAAWGPLNPSAGPIELPRPSPPAAPTQPVPPEVLTKVQALYDGGLCLQALRAAETFAPLTRWTDTPARVLAGRLAGNVGAYRLAHFQHWRAWRADKSNPDLVAYHANSLLSRRGPLAALDFVERCAEPPESFPPDGRMHFFTLRATLAAQMRDFTACVHWLERASATSPNSAWVATTRAHVLEIQDRYPEALEAARQALEWRPWYRPGVQALAHALQLLDRDEEALALLVEANVRLENMHVARQLAALQEEAQLYPEAAATLNRFAELAPLMEKGDRMWLERHRLKLDCLRNNWPAAQAAAKQIDEPYYRELAERLEKGGPHRRVRLEVPFVRQHHLTCAPATLSAMSRYWQQPAEHLEVAEAICYDGTPAHSERNWAETHGWMAREFRVTWEAAVALLDRGIPFTLTTSGATSGHLQAVVGYDAARQTLWIRDPFVYTTNEGSIKPMLESFRSTGPRGMAIVPAHRRELLEDLDLPDATFYDQLHQVERALAQHRRAEALDVCQQMQTAAPDHRLTLVARRSIASYDSNTPALLEAIEQLLKQFPNDANLNLAKLSCLRELARRDERLRLLEALCAKPGTEPIFWLQYAQELRADARQHGAAASWVRWALRYRPTDPAMVSAWADLLWDERQFARATRHYHLAACLGDKSENFTRSFFIASRHLRQTEAALEFLHAREARLGKKSADPTITLVESLQHLRRSNEAFAALEAALARRPDDGGLRLFAADVNGRFARFDAATKLLEQARAHSSPVNWRRAAASLAGYQNQKAVALEHWREVLKLEPLSHEAIRASALLLAETEGREAALRFLNELCARFPFSCPLLTLRIQWVEEDGADAAIPHLRHLLEVNPADAWAWRELALKLASGARSSPGATKFETKGELEASEQEATELVAPDGHPPQNPLIATANPLEAAEEAIRLEPHHSAGYSVRADIFVQQGRLAEAHADFGQALRLEVDNEYALTHFVDTAPTLAERTKALAEVAAELRRQVIFRDALSAYQTAARGLLPPQEVLGLLREAHAARPDLWQAWSVLIHQLVDLGQHEEALKLAREAAARFPLLPRLWVDLARVEQARLDAPAEIAALENALALSPGYTFASRLLAGIYERQHELAKAREVLENAVAGSPLDALNHGCLAQVLWKLGERDAALSRVQHALRLQPGYDWAWNALRNWGPEVGRPNLALDTARELTRSRAGETRSWLLLARCLDPQKDADELFAALDKAVTLNPRAEEAYDLRARALTNLNRFDEALAECSPSVFQPAPARLQLRAAWIESQRGNLHQAIARATTALKEYPDYYAGWQMLSDWYVRLDHADEAVQAAEKMAALAPLEAVPLGYLGDLKLRLKDRAGAQTAFARAFTLDPDYQYAGYQLFQLQLEDRKLEPAEQTLKVLQRHGDDHRTVSCAIELAAARQQWDRALELFRQLCARKDTESWSLARGAHAVERRPRKAGRDAFTAPFLWFGNLFGFRPANASVARVLEQHASSPDCSPALAEFWVERRVRSGNWNLHKRLNALKANGEAGRRAVLRYLGMMGEAFQTARNKNDVTTPIKLRYHFGRLFRKHRYWLETDVEGWGKVGFALTCIGRPGPVINWLGDWKKRPEAESWMLYNLILMLQRKGRYEESCELIRHAVSLRHGEDLYQVFRVWAAFEEALRGNIEQAEAHLATVPANDVREHLLPVKAMTQILATLSRQTDAERKQGLQTVQNRLKKTFGKRRPCKATRYARDGYWRFLDAAAPRVPGLRWWGWWYYRGAAWLWYPALVAVLPLAIAAPPLAVVLIVFWMKRAQRD
jgi:tetratricopeptide (TPR) repeat protein